MKVKRTFLGGVLLLVCAGCVTTGRYTEKVEEAKGLESALQVARQRFADLGRENDGLKTQVAQLAAEKAGLAGERDQLAGARESLAKERDRCLITNRELQADLGAKADILSKTVAELRLKNTAVEGENQKLAETVFRREAENTKLKEEIVVLQKTKEEEVKRTSKTFEDLLEKMKSEIAKGEVTISELQGRLTVNLVDAVLFDVGKDEVKPEGLSVLRKVVDILQGVKDKSIRVEGHTDNLPIRGGLARRFPTNWELSSARAVNVARYLQQQGISPDNLAAVAYGEYRPVAGNDSDEGRAKNRRIEIVLAPRE